MSFERSHRKPVRHWYKHYPGDFLQGTMAMSAEEKGVYITVLDLIYSRGEPIQNDGQWIARMAGCSTRRWGQIRDKLMSQGKILMTLSGNLTNGRADKELLNSHLSQDKMEINTTISYVSKDLTKKFSTKHATDSASRLIVTTAYENDRPPEIISDLSATLSASKIGDKIEIKSTVAAENNDLTKKTPQIPSCARAGLLQRRKKEREDPPHSLSESKPASANATDPVDDDPPPSPWENMPGVHSRPGQPLNRKPYFPCLDDAPAKWADLVRVDEWAIDDQGKRRPAAGGTFVETAAENVVSAVHAFGRDPVRKDHLDWRPLIGWLRDGCTLADITAALKHATQSPSYPPRNGGTITSLNYFDKTVRGWSHRRLRSEV